MADHSNVDAERGIKFLIQGHLILILGALHRTQEGLVHGARLFKRTGPALGS